MSEYIEIEAEIGDDGDHIYLYTNLPLAQHGVEEYASAAEMEEGSPVAQTLAVIAGIDHLRIEEDEMVIRRAPNADWHVIVEDVSAALKDFFL